MSVKRLMFLWKQIYRFRFDRLNMRRDFTGVKGTTSSILIIKAFLVSNYTIVLYPEQSWNGILLYIMLYRLSLFSFVVLNKMKSSTV